MAAPILKSIHNGTDSSPIELYDTRALKYCLDPRLLTCHSDLLPYIKERDSASIATAKQSSELTKTLDELARAQSDALRISRANVSMTSELLELAEEAKRKRLGRMSGPAMEAEMKSAEEEAKESRQKWKVIKGTASAVIVGSGVDWVGDPELRDVVLDPEDDG